MFRLSSLIDSTLNNRPQRGLKGSIAIWNFTNRCNLTCSHCYSYADPNSRDFLTTETILETIPKLKRAGVGFVIFSGGEPLIRKDIFEIASYMRERGVVTYLSTNGLYINENSVKRVVETFDYIGISIDGIGEVHNRFRGMDGAYEKSIKAIKLIQANGGNAGIRFTLTKETGSSFYEIFELAESIGVDKLYISHLVYSGRGLENLEIDISKEERREYLNFIIDKAFEYYRGGKNINIVTGNMEMDAILLIKRFESEYPEYRDALIERLKSWGGNSAGRNLVNIDSLGNIKPDPFFPKSVGNITKMDFDKVWLDGDNQLLSKLRKEPRDLKGICEKCRVKSICNGGSRSRAWAIYGDLWAEDPSCYLSEEERSMEI